MTLEVERLANGHYKWRMSAPDDTPPETLAATFAQLRECFPHALGADCTETCAHWHGDTRVAFEPTPVSAHRQVDLVLAERVLAVLRASECPLTISDIQRHIQDSHYLTIRATLLHLTEQNRVARTGSGGRKGYLYSLGVPNV